MLNSFEEFLISTVVFFAFFFVAKLFVEMVGKNLIEYYLKRKG